MKLALKLVAVVVALIIIAAVVGVVYIDSMARRGVESGTTYALGVPTTLKSADVGLLSGEFSLSGLNVSNPPGDFTTPQFLTLDDGSLAVELGTLRDDVVEVPTLKLSGVTMNLERKGARSNYKIILDNLERFESKEPDPAAQKYVIRQLEIRDITVHVDLVPEGGQLAQVDVPIDVIQLQNVGSGGEEVRLSDLAGVILKAIITVAVAKGGGLIPDDIAAELTASLADLQDLGDQGVTILLGDGGVVETFGKTAEELGKEVEEGAKKIGEDARKIGEGIGDIFRKDEDGEDDK